MFFLRSADVRFCGAQNKFYFFCKVPKYIGFRTWKFKKKFVNLLKLFYAMNQLYNIHIMIKCLFIIEIINDKFI